ncbi:MAG TPA: NUDIX hydrolase [Pyrinomonadaceae bacterium]|nr:NUDIX hydrolase [Pyrinomonadaceae bacterium]
MLKRLVAGAWKGAPRFVRRAGVWLTQPRFTVTAGVVVSDERGRVLLLRHTLRGGSGWGIPGGFIARGEQPEEAVRREVKEETDLELQEVELVFVRTLRHAQQVECIFRGRMRAAAIGRQQSSFEVERAEWFERARLPADLGADQRRLIERALGDGGKRAE